MVKTYILFVIFACVFSNTITPAIADPLSDGKLAYESESYEKSAALLKPEADEGNPDAATLYALQLLNGLGVEQNRIEAQVYFIKGAYAGSKEAQYLYFYFFGRGKDDLYLEMLKNAASQGHVGALSAVS